jgi:polysaccharide biosynthesis/export protein
MLVAFACVPASPDAGLDVAPAYEALPPGQLDPELSAALQSMVASARRQRHTYKIGADDVLRLNIWMRPDLSKDGVVRDDGTFFVPLAGNVPVADLSLAEAQETIRLALSKYLREPQVDLEVKEYQSQLFFANGLFTHPGSYPIRGTTTVLEGISNAGGVAENGNLQGAYLVRKGKVVPIDFVSLFTRGAMSQNIPLADGDLIYVPSIETARVYVLGEVLRPTGVPVRTGKITLGQAIVDAGGFNETTAYKRGVKIIRGGLGSGEVTEVNFQDVIKGKRPDLMLLEPGDIVYVPASGLAKWDRVMGQILPNLSRIVVDAAAIDAMNR